MYVFIDLDVDFFQTQTARKLKPARDPTGEIESSLACRREPTGYLNGL